MGKSILWFYPNGFFFEKYYATCNFNYIQYIQQKLFSKETGTTIFDFWTSILCLYIRHHSVYIYIKTDNSNEILQNFVARSKNIIQKHLFNKLP